MLLRLWPTQHQDRARSKPDDALRSRTEQPAIEAFARVAEGKAKWTDELVLTKEKKVGGAGILPVFGDGLRLTLRDAVTLMMVLSDNTATNLVIDVLTADAINARMESRGNKETSVLRRVF